MPAFAIETARPEHAGEIARLSGELGYPATADEIAQRLASLSAASHAYVAVAAAPDGRLLGWMVVERHCCLESGEEAELAGLVVSSDARRLGVGRALVAAAEAWTRAAGFAKLRVRSNVLRVESHALYRGIGFVPVKTQHTYEKLLP